jgi:hypothetical protein
MGISFRGCLLRVPGDFLDHFDVPDFPQDISNIILTKGTQGDFTYKGIPQAIGDNPVDNIPSGGT